MFLLHEAQRNSTALVTLTKSLKTVGGKFCENMQLAAELISPGSEP